MKLAVQKYLETHTKEELQATGINVKIDQETRCLLLDYDQILASKLHPITIECRGLILNLDTLDVVCRSFDRFFNYGEADTDKLLNFNQCVVEEKPDGSMIRIFWNPSTELWQVATRGTTDGSATTRLGRPYREIVWELLGATNNKEFQKACKVFNPTYTYTFELIGPANLHVTRYSKNELVLLNIRDTKAGRELSNQSTYEAAQYLSYRFNVRPLKVYSLNNIKECLEYVETLPNLEEGFVLRDLITGFRVKLKSKKFLEAFKLRGNSGPTQKSIVELVSTGEQDEFLTYFPEFKEEFQPVIQRYEEIMAQVKMVLVSFQDLDQKEFALKVKDHPASALIFQCRKTGESPEEVFKRMYWNTKVGILYDK